jgi:hypothetical protein
MRLKPALAFSFCAAVWFSPYSQAQTCGGLNVSVAPFTPTGETSISAGTTASSVALSTNGSTSPAATKMVVTNLGQTVVYVLAGDASVAATINTGFPVLPSTSVTLSVGSATYISTIVASGVAGMRISTGY